MQLLECHALLGTCSTRASRAKDGFVIGCTHSVKKRLHQSMANCQQSQGWKMLARWLLLSCAVLICSGAVVAVKSAGKIKERSIEKG